MNLKEYKQKVAGIINSQDISWNTPADKEKSAQKELKIWKEKQLTNLENNTIQGTLRFYSDRYPVLIHISEDKTGKPVCDWVKEFDSKCLNYYNGDWEVDFDVLKDTTYSLVWNKWIEEFSHSKNKQWKDRGYDFEPIVCERYEDPSF